MIFLKKIVQGRSLPEQLHHGIDYLDGILAVQRAIDGRSFYLSGEWGKQSKGQ